MGPSQPTAADMQAFGRGFSAVTMVDVIVAHSPLWFSLLTGMLAGFLLWSIPLALWGFNTLLTRINTGAFSDSGAFMRLLPQIAPWLLATGILGLTLGALRRLSARYKRYITLGNMTLGLNTFFASSAGLIFVFFLLTTGGQAGPFIWILGLGAPLMGFIVDGIWQMFHDQLVQRLGRPDTEALLAMEAENFIRRHPGLTGFSLSEVQISGRTAYVKGTWESTTARERMQQALICIEGIDRVECERVDPA